MRTYVYVDGFNLYYGALRGTPYKWLNLHTLCTLLLPGYQVEKIKYFTAHIQARLDAPDQPTRQQMYLRALRTLPNLEIILGHFLMNAVSMRLVQPPAVGSAFVRVIKTEEKGSEGSGQVPTNDLQPGGIRPPDADPASLPWGPQTLIIRPLTGAGRGQRCM